MNWKTKAHLVNLLAMLPSSLSYRLYETAQMWFGAYRHGNNPFGRLAITGEFIQTLEKLGLGVKDKHVLEVGSGRSLLLPIGCWLAGAGKITSVDLHPYLSEDMFLDDIKKIQTDGESLRKAMGDSSKRDVFDSRYSQLKAWSGGRADIPQLLSDMSIDYQAPADATELELADDSVDIHTSVAVLEHIPADILKAIFMEGSRVTKPGGWFVHRWDMSDHFSHKDPSIPAVNFLQFDEQTWSKYNDNRYMYVNRLRIDFFDELFSESNLKVQERITGIDERSLQEIRDGFPLAAPFDRKDAEVNATRSAIFYAEKQATIS